MSLSRFLLQLRRSGRVVLQQPDSPSDQDLAEAEIELRLLDAETRREFPGEAPALSLPVASWAAVRLYRACQFFVFRELEPDTVQEDLRVPCPGSLSCESAYSADLTLRHLPQLVGLARGISPGDALVVGLQELAQSWPLSSVGLGEAAPSSKQALEVVVTHPGLLALYVDRITVHEDTSRLCEPRVSKAVQAALGLYPQLSPRVAAALATQGEGVL